MSPRWGDGTDWSSERGDSNSDRDDRHKNDSHRDSNDYVDSSEARRKAEAEAKRKAEEEAKRKAEAEAKLKAEAEAKRKAEAEAKRKAEAEAKRKAEAEAKRKADEEFDREAKENMQRISDIITAAATERQEEEFRNWLDFPKLSLMAFFVNHPSIAFDIGTFEKGATNITTNSIRFSTQGRGPHQLESIFSMMKDGAGSQTNAFRHGVWMGTIAARYGEEVAQFAGNAHEGLPFSKDVRIFNHFDLNNRYFDSAHPKLEADRVVDFLNNEIGRQIGKESSSKSMKDISLKVLEHFHKEGMYVFTDGSYVVNKGYSSLTIGQQKITDQQYNYTRYVFDRVDDNGDLLPGLQFDPDGSGKIIPKK
ncbi:hypothetical protein KKJ17_08960 [Xenorhabdus bovienii]|uniref:cell envelope integrity protein TolA n=1 Tax=Xenorhabdus bovienii TaxID=40576 RepID=UPI0023B286F2|nr:hypothetical protein [Xenorhabdus bovienii]MDE9517865.1 hypothetical protein [Xenorhabdus bovienii]